MDESKANRFTPLCDDMAAAVCAFLDYARAKNLSPRTVEFYADRMRAFTTFVGDDDHSLPPKDVTPATIRDFILYTRGRCSAATVNHNINVLRIFFRFMIEDGFLHENPAERVHKLRQPKRIIETFSLEHVEAMLAACGRDFLGLRDRAIIAVLFDTGLRVQELTALSFSDIEWSDHSLRVVGKGDKERTVPFGVGVRRALNSYMTRRGDIPNQPRVFVTHLGEDMDRYAVRRLIKKRAQLAGVSGPRISPHTLRHSFCKQYLLNGGDIFSLQRILGHTSLDMVRNYMNLAREDVGVIHGRFSPVDRMNEVQSPRLRKTLR